MNKENYLEKLKDPKWQKKRLEILKRDKFSCMFCGDDEKTLHVHHFFYYKNREPWEYPDTSLITLCKDCHKVIKEYDIRSWILEYIFRGYDPELLMREISYGQLIGTIREYENPNDFISDYISWQADRDLPIKLNLND